MESHNGRNSSQIERLSRSTFRVDLNVQRHVRIAHGSDSVHCTPDKKGFPEPVGLRHVCTLVNARLALCLASDGVLSLQIRVTMVALLSNSFCQTNAGTQETDFQLLF